MKQFKRFIILASLSTVLTHSGSSAVYSAMDTDEGPASAPARTIAPTDVTLVNRKPAVEPRVYVESTGSKTGFVYYDTNDRPDSAARAKAQHSPDQ
jgi:hypothetical protein